MKLILFIACVIFFIISITYRREETYLSTMKEVSPNVICGEFAKSIALNFCASFSTASFISITFSPYPSNNNNPF